MLNLMWSTWLVCALAPSAVEPPASEPPPEFVDEMPAEAAEPGDPSVAEQDVPPEPPEGEPDAATDAEASATPSEPAPEPEAEAEPVPEPEAEAEPAPEPEPEADAEAAAEADVEPEPISSAMDALEPSIPPPLAPKHRLVYKNLFALRYNPLGLVNENTLGWAMRLYERRGALFEPAYVGAKLHTFVSPAYSRVGPQVEFSPLAILNLSATYDFIGYYGTFNQMQSFATPAVDYSDTQLGENDDNGASYPTWGSMVTLSALLQAKAGPIAIRDNLKGYYTDFKLRDGGKVFYDQTLDILVPDGGWSLTNDLDLLVLFNNGLKLGARYTVTQAFYKKRHFQQGEPVSQPNGPTHRIGPAVLYTFYDKPQRRFNKPTLIVLSQWWARHRYRTGADVNAAVPYIVLGFLFEGDLLPNPKKTYGKKK